MTTIARGGLGRMVPTTIAATLAVMGVGLAVVSLLMWADQGFPPLAQSLSRTPVGVIPSQVLAIACIVVGALLGYRMPRNPIGWLLLVAGYVMVMILPVALLVAQSHETFRPASEAVRLSAWAESSLSTPIVVACLALVGLLFPDGRLPTRWQQGAAVLIVLAAVPFAAATALDPSGLVWYPTIANPFAAPPGLERAFVLMRAIGALLMLGAAVAVAASIAKRYRTGDAVTRAQLRWIVLAVAVSVLTEVPFVLARYVVPTSDATGEIIVAVVNLGMTAIPIAAAFAITRYRLFGIDRLIDRALVYVPLVGVLGGLYAVAVALFQRVFVAVTGSPSDAPLLIAVFLIAAAFTPVRKSLEGAVDRWSRSGMESAAPGGRNGPDDTEEPQDARAALASIRRLEAHVATGSGGVTSGEAQTWAIREDGSVDCPTGSRVPFPTCLGCPYFESISIAPPVVRCWRSASS